MLPSKRGEVGLSALAGRCCCEAQARFLIWDGALGNLYSCCYPGKSQVKSGTGPRFVLMMWFLHTAAHGRILKVSRANISYLKNIFPIGRMPSFFFFFFSWWCCGQKLIPAAQWQRMRGFTFPSSSLDERKCLHEKWEQLTIKIKNWLQEICHDMQW